MKRPHPIELLAARFDREVEGLTNDGIPLPSWLSSHHYHVTTYYVRGRAVRDLFGSELVRALKDLHDHRSYYLDQVRVASDFLEKQT